MNSKLNRRRFLKSGIVGTSGLFAAPFLAKGNPLQPKATRKKEYTMVKRILGNTGLEVPVVSFGVMRSDSDTVVKAAIEAGITHFDTAHNYQEGRNEEMLGKVFKEYDRDALIIATKVLPEDHIINSRYEKLGKESTTEKFLERLETSLQRLQMDYVDILYVHAIRSYDDALFEPILEAVTAAKQQGKARFAGVSTHRNEPDVIQAIIDSDVYDVVLAAINFRQSHKDKMKEIIEAAALKGIGIIGMKSMGGAYWDRERTRPINCKAALKWVLQNKNVHATIPGMVSFDQLEENLSVMENLEMTEEEKASLLPPEGFEAGLYCPGCGKCIEQCPYHLPIPDISRAYMYAYGYKEPKKAYDLMQQLQLPDYLCETCDICTVSCPNGFMVDKKIKDIIRLKTIPEEFLS